MPLASLASLHWYGPACFAAVDSAPSTGTATLRVVCRLGSLDVATATATAKIHAGQAVRAVGQAGSTGTAQPRVRARIGAIGKVNDAPSASEIATAIWGSVSAIYAQPGTMGEKLNAAGSAANPWTDPTGADVATRTTELHRLAGLDPAAPLTVTPTSRTAGDINQAITGDGDTTTTVTRA